MRLKQCALMNFRNYVSQKLTFHPQLTVLVGANAQGKSNFLEAVYVCARGRTFKSNTEKELIRFGAQDAYVLADIEREHIEKRVEIKFSNRSKKRIRINGIEIAQIKDLVYQFDVVLFAPEHLQMVQSGPQFRREFIDDLLRGIDPLYEKRMQYYHKVLRQRNQFL